MAEWISVEAGLPKPGMSVFVHSPIRFRGTMFRLIRYSPEDGDYFWDNMIDEILQAHEVTHWSPVWIVDPPGED